MKNTNSIQTARITTITTKIITKSLSTTVIPLATQKTTISARSNKATTLLDSAITSTTDKSVGIYYYQAFDEGLRHQIISGFKVRHAAHAYSPATLMRSEFGFKFNQIDNGHISFKKNNLNLSKLFNEYPKPYLHAYANITQKMNNSGKTMVVSFTARIEEWLCVELAESTNDRKINMTNITHQSGLHFSILNPKYQEVQNNFEYIYFGPCERRKIIEEKTSVNDDERTRKYRFELRRDNSYTVLFDDKIIVDDQLCKEPQATFEIDQIHLHMYGHTVIDNISVQIRNQTSISNHRRSVSTCDTRDYLSKVHQA
jgi:hypothetical protein